MPFNVLLLPLLGGYVFISHWNHTRFEARRYTGERLIFHAAIAGAAVLLIAFVVTRFLVVLWPSLYARWRTIVPFEYTGTSLLALILGALGWWPLNFWWDHDEEAHKTIENRGDFLERLLDDAMSKTGQVSITLTTGKVYVGFVARNFDPAFDRKYMALVPTLSGYRDRGTQKMEITTDYTAMYDKLKNHDFATSQYDFELIIPTAEVRSASHFDPDVYKLFGDLGEDGVSRTAD